MNALRFGFRLGGGVVLLMAAVVASAQAPAVAKTAPVTGPVPMAIPAAKRIFVANGGADAGLFPHPFSGSVARGYDDFYADINGLGRYELVASPGQADLVLEFQLLAPVGPASPDKQKGAADPLPTVRVKIYDRVSHFVLWAFSEQVDGAITQQAHDRKLDEAIARLAEDFEGIAGSRQ